MRITQVGYSMLRVTKQYENDRAEATVEVGPKDDPVEAYELARKTVTDALARGREGTLRSRVEARMATARGREDLERALARIDPIPF